MLLVSEARFVLSERFCLVQVSGLTSSMQLIYVQADLCKTRDSTLGTNLNLMRKITKYVKSSSDFRSWNHAAAFRTCCSSPHRSRV